MNGKKYELHLHDNSLKLILTPWYKMSIEIFVVMACSGANVFY